jgi:hypothetical protein
MIKPAQNKAAQIREYIAANPKAKPAEIGKAVGSSKQYVYIVQSKEKAKVAKKAKAAKKTKTKLTLPKPDWKRLGFFSSDTPVVEDAVTDTYKDRMMELAYAATTGRAKIRMEGNRGGDPVNNPAHYTVGGIETIDFIEAKKLNYRLGNVVKYLTRADHKGNKIEDLRKAQWFLEREIESLS